MSLTFTSYKSHYIHKNAYIDHIPMDFYIEEFFPEHNIRLIAVADGIDTAEGEDELTPFRNLINVWYARDIGKKQKLTNVIRGNAGIPLSLPPYGYLKDPEDDKRCQDSTVRNRHP